MTIELVQLREKHLLEAFFERAMKDLDPTVAAVLDRALDGKELRVDEAYELFKIQSSRELHALVAVADGIRKASVGDIVTFVINRNINFTNICYIGCRFCSFSRPENDVDAWHYSIEEILEKAREAKAMGATEVCIQGGINPKVDANIYLDICRAIKQQLPDMHIHAFSPWEVLYASRKSGLTVEDFLKQLRDSGLDSMPGTAAEILDDKIRRVIAPSKLSAEMWVKVVKTAHRVGIPTTATIMYGHVDTPLHWVKHMALIREIQKETRGFTEFVPLSFIHYNTPLYREGLARPGALGSDDVKMYAVARLMLNGCIPNIQVSWVKLGAKLAQYCLTTGANDFGGTLMNEHISRMAGASSEEYMAPERFVSMIRGIGRIPAQRSTTYEILRTYDV